MGLRITCQYYSYFSFVRLPIFFIKKIRRKFGKSPLANFFFWMETGKFDFFKIKDVKRGKLHPAPLLYSESHSTARNGQERIFWLLLCNLQMIGRSLYFFFFNTPILGTPKSENFMLFKWVIFFRIFLPGQCRRVVSIAMKAGSVINVCDTVKKKISLILCLRGFRGHSSSAAGPFRFLFFCFEAWRIRTKGGFDKTGSICSLPWWDGKPHPLSGRLIVNIW